MEALILASQNGTIPSVALVVANLACPALGRAQALKVPTRLLPSGDFGDRTSFELALIDALEEAGVDLVCLAGFMRLLTPVFLTRYGGRVLNIHPSLLPAFPGLHAPRQAIAAGVRISGCTVHFVDAGLDSGAIVAQAAVPVRSDDDESSLAERILEQEHRLYPAAVGWVASRRIELRDGRAQVASPFETRGSLQSPSLT
jgi:formyltetrahydrofolate-dependent phosphoribosylglycinamide formyltransferase